MKNQPEPIARTNILGVGVSALTMPLALAQIAGWVERGERQYVCVTGVHGVIESQRDPSLRAIHNQAGLVTPDGMPLVWLSRRLGHPDVQRVYGPDLLLAACEYGQTLGWRHYFYGAAPGTASLLAERLQARYPGMAVAGVHSPPFRALSAAEEQAEREQINAARADILWVGMSTPKQERWMAAHLGPISVPVMIGVGAAFDFHAGLKKQAPIWMQRGGLEWLFRLLSEPKRLGPRYLVNNPLFAALVFLQLSGLRKYRL
jgi:N-acetylglucosaminyldiphosphoundecaprenol N-acetyl-beta-D-mannosaminyltransferase